MDNAEQIYESLQEYADIKRLLESEQEENLFLDFKTKSREEPGTTKEDRDNYAEALSGFANSAGGVIVWGIDARKRAEDGADVASEEKPINNLKRFLTDLNTLTGQAVMQTVEGVMNKVIEKDDDSGFVITLVPRSEKRPHRAEMGQKYYYKRSGSNFMVMEHYEIQDMFFRVRAPNVYIDIGYFLHTSGPMKHTYSLKIIVKNLGSILVEHFAVQLDMPRFMPQSVMYFTRVKAYENRGVYQYVNAGGGNVLFPGEEREITGGNCCILYSVTDETYNKYESEELRWTVFADNMPAKHGTKPLKELQEY